jgi:CelD/BcsL family acetyltransferase involved in cellulose biosynthesis
MFDYVKNRFNPSPNLFVLGGGDDTPPPDDELIHDIKFSTISCLPVPADMAALRALRSRKYWSARRRYERHLSEQVGPVSFRVLTHEADLREALPKVQKLYRERWADEYTSLDWKSPEGFQPYADAMVDLASTGEAELAVLEVGDRLLSFGYSLINNGSYHFYQHATTLDPACRQYGPGTLLLPKLLTHVVDQGKCHTVDFMLGECEYKAAWATYHLPVYLRVQESRSLSGFVRFGTSVALRRAKVFAQFNPVLRPIGKWAMLTMRQ